MIVCTFGPQDLNVSDVGLKTIIMDCFKNAQGPKLWNSSTQLGKTSVSCIQKLRLLYVIFLATNNQVMLIGISTSVYKITYYVQTSTHICQHASIAIHMI